MRLRFDVRAFAHGVPGVGTNSKEHVRHRRGNGLENRCALSRRPECDSLVLRHSAKSCDQTAAVLHEPGEG